MEDVATFNDPCPVFVINRRSSGLDHAMVISSTSGPTTASWPPLITSRRRAASPRSSGIERARLEVTDAKSVRTAIKSITGETHGRIDALINDGGSMPPHSPHRARIGVLINTRQHF
ncbi:NADPH-dependent 1-acyl dihydroxyacetone phosphate reductase [Thecaphora frezii]